MNEEQLKEYEDQVWDLSIRIDQSIRYHNHRKRFFVSIHNWITFLVALTGTATFAAVIGPLGQKTPLIFAFLVTVCSLADLIVRSPEKIRLYDELSRKFIALEKKLLLSKEPDPDLLLQIRADILDIESDEPPPLRILNAVCRNETLQAKGCEKDKTIGRWQHRFKNFCDLNPDNV